MLLIPIKYGICFCFVLEAFSLASTLWQQNKESVLRNILVKIMRQPASSPNRHPIWETRQSQVCLAYINREKHKADWCLQSLLFLTKYMFLSWYSTYIQRKIPPSLCKEKILSHEVLKSACVKWNVYVAMTFK